MFHLDRTGYPETVASDCYIYIQTEYFPDSTSFLFTIGMVQSGRNRKQCEIKSTMLMQW